MRTKLAAFIVAALVFGGVTLPALAQDCARQKQLQAQWDAVFFAVDDVDIGLLLVTDVVSGFIPQQRVIQRVLGLATGAAQRALSKYGVDLTKYQVAQADTVQIIRMYTAYKIARAYKSTQNKLDVLVYGACPALSAECKAEVRALMFKRRGLDAQCS